jgi:hypothetical protein
MNVTLLKEAANPHAVYSSKVIADCCFYNVVRLNAVLGSIY